MAYSIVSILFFVALAVAIVVGLVRAERTLVEAREDTWQAHITRIEETMGRLESRPNGGGATTIQPERRFALVYYVRDGDGAQGCFYVGEPGPYPNEPEAPPFDEVWRVWKKGDRLEKAAGSLTPHRVST